MIIEIRALAKREEDRIASTRNEQAEWLEKLIRDVQRQAAGREKALKEELEEAGRQQRQQFTEMLCEQERKITDRKEKIRRALEVETKRNKELAAVPGDGEMKVSERFQAQQKETSATLSTAKQGETHEQRLRVAEKVRPS
jgi:hypothetical protein